MAKARAREGAPEGLVVLAEEQTGGKGRLGRRWHSPPGQGIWMTVVLRPPLPPAEVPRLTLVAAVAVAGAIRQVAGLPVGIKWPNDIVCRDRKLCGILTEMEADMERVHFAAVGIGINVNQDPAAFPPELRETATSLRAELGAPVDRAALLRAVLAELEAGYDALLAGRFAAEVLPRWRECSVTLGRRVRVTPVVPGAEVLTGLAREVAEDGALILELPDGTLRRVVAGEVSLRPEE
ncbi:MAG: biotin--[acetyl-CoA-carboxylase] ligase [Firmicutes bacterium]|nr:biotin--[acetyl-CoA-carboxylase] ligase [Bacillota bacterium]